MARQQLTRHRKGGICVRAVQPIGASSARVAAYRSWSLGYSVRVPATHLIRAMWRLRKLKRWFAANDVWIYKVKACRASRVDSLLPLLSKPSIICDRSVDTSSCWTTAAQTSSKKPSCTLLIQFLHLSWQIASMMPSGSVELLTKITAPCAETSTQAPPLHQLLRRHSLPGGRSEFNATPSADPGDTRPAVAPHGRHEQVTAVNQPGGLSSRADVTGVVSVLMDQRGLAASNADSRERVLGTSLIYSI